MFEATLLDSALLRAPLLKPIDRLVSLGAGVLGFLAALLSLPMVLVPHGAKALLAESVMAGMACLLSALMLCYVHADARRLGLRVWVWSGVTLCFSLVGFLAYLAYSASRAGDWRRAALPLAYVLEVGLVSVLVLVPLISTGALPKMTALADILPLPPAPPLGSQHPPAETRSVRHVTAQQILNQPPAIPSTVKRIADPPEPPQPVAFEGFGVRGGVPNGVYNSVLTAGNALPPPPLPAAKRTQRAPTRVGGQVEAAKLIWQPMPPYPPLARMARIQGAVRLEAVIGTDGTVQNLKVLAGHPLLVKAATDAVSRWRYQPTLLNGEPVEVLTEVLVTFNLAE